MAGGEGVTLRRLPDGVEQGHLHPGIGADRDLFDIEAAQVPLDGGMGVARDGGAGWINGPVGAGNLDDARHAFGDGGVNDGDLFGGKRLADRGEQEEFAGAREGGVESLWVGKFANRNFDAVAEQCASGFDAAREDPDGFTSIEEPLGYELTEATRGAGDEDGGAHAASRRRAASRGP